MTVARQYRVEKMTIEEYKNLPENERVEVIEGVVYDLAAPSDAHQAASVSLTLQFATYLRGKTCMVRHAPYDVYLNDYTVVQPDLMVLCDPNKKKPDGCHGAPDLVIEILSPSNRLYEQKIKMDLYRKHGVREYWVVDLASKEVHTYTLIGEYYIASGIYGPEDSIQVQVLENCKINLSEVFGEDAE